MSSTNRAATRRTNDDYPTPTWCTDLILSELHIPKKTVFLEPCKGDGAIFERVPVHMKHWAEITAGVDYLTTQFEVDLIITNPPFSMASEFLTKSLSEGRCVAYLLRLGFLGSQARRGFWQENRPSHLFALSRRPSFTGKGTDSADYAWFVWDKAGFCKRQPGIYVV